jgi:hypothetical protein
MTDIDFDELDRAVNSLVNPDAKTAPVTPDTPSPAVTPPSDSSVSPVAERRSSGRFMDVVHPSSDMRGSVPPRPTQRETTKEPEEPTRLDNSAVSSESAAAWPDPLDAQKTPQTSDDETKTSEPETPKENNKPLDSPFLSDAKVEKRPLGAFSDESHEEINGDSTTDSATPVNSETTEANPTETPSTSESTDQTADSDTPMPAELQPGLLSIEANEDPEAEKPEAVEPAGPTSITQQYSPQPSTGDKPAATMFDTTAYKKPQAHAGKKKSGWLVIVWILLLLIVGTGIGAAVYFFVLPRL